MRTLITLCSLMIAAVWPIAASASLDEVDDLQKLAQQSRQHQAPILIMVSQAHCAFCRTLREEVLEPMVISGDYTERAIMGEMMMDTGVRVTDWNGKDIATAEFAERYGVWVTPTLLFLDAEGNTLHPPMLGVNTVEMYGYYLDQALDAAKEKLIQAQPE